MIAIPDGMRCPAEVERDELRKELADANALIKSINDNHQRYVKDSTEHAMNLELELAEAQTEIESLTRSLVIVANWENIDKIYTADEVKEFARGILDVSKIEAAGRGE